MPEGKYVSMSTFIGTMTTVVIATVASCFALVTYFLSDHKDRIHAGAASSDEMTAVELRQADIERQLYQSLIEIKGDLRVIKARLNIPEEGGD